MRSGQLDHTDLRDRSVTGAVAVALIIRCCGIPWARPPVSEDSQSQQECIACAAAVASLEEARNGHDTGWKSVSLSASGVPQTFFTLCSGKILGIIHILM